MGVANYLDDEEVTVGLTRDEIRLVARRQLVASLAAALVILAGAALAVLIPASHGDVRAAAHRVAGVHQPTLSSLPYQAPCRLSNLRLSFPELSSTQAAEHRGPAGCSNFLFPIRQIRAIMILRLCAS